VSNFGERGLLNWGFTRAARLVGIGNRYLTNYKTHAPNLVWNVFTDPVIGVYHLQPMPVPNWFAPFPYGSNVEPP
jgi:hypothetical protein